MSNLGGLSFLGIHPYLPPRALRRRPKEWWMSVGGELLLLAGKSQKRPSKTLPTADALQTQVDAVDASRNTLLAALNASLPEGVSVIPWSMVPWSLWRGPRAAFLMIVCDFYPASCLNTFLMAKNAQSAEMLGLPLHPRILPAEFAENCERLVGQAQDEFQDAFDKVDFQMKGGVAAAFKAQDAARQKSAAAVCNIAHGLTVQLFGKPAYALHRELFGAALGWQTKTEPAGAATR
ncbi:MAG: hypothetical protein GY948_12445 [Alphaproteobacteria bacterium]|nr:hypothetical protein [Alphaproteobacteria bacterium]